MSYALLRSQDAGRTVTSEAVAVRVAANLIAASIEFHVEPLPGDVWDFNIKRDKYAYEALEAAIDQAYKG